MRLSNVSIWFHTSIIQNLRDYKYCGLNTTEAMKFPIQERQLLEEILTSPINIFKLPEA